MQHSFYQFMMPRFWDGNFLYCFSFLPLRSVTYQMISLLYIEAISCISSRRTDLPSYIYNIRIAQFLSSGYCVQTMAQRSTHLPCNLQFPIFPKFFTRHSTPLTPILQCLKNPTTQNQHTEKTSSQTLRHALTRLAKCGSINFSQITRSLQQDYQFFRRRLILSIMCKIWGLAALFVIEVKNVQSWVSVRSVRKSEQLWQKQAISLSSRVNGYRNRKILDEQFLALPHISITFFNITCSFSTQSCLIVKARLFSLTAATILQTFSYCSALRVWKQLTHYMMLSISGSPSEMYYYFRKQGNVQVRRARVYWAILEFGSLQIHVERSVIYPFYMRLRYCILHLPAPKQLIFFLLLNQYKKTSITKFCTRSNPRSIIVITSRKQFPSLFSISYRTSIRIFQLSQLPDWSSSVIDLKELFYYWIFFVQRCFSLQWVSSSDIFWVIFYLLQVRDIVLYLQSIYIQIQQWSIEDEQESCHQCSRETGTAQVHPYRQTALNPQNRDSLTQYLIDPIALSTDVQEYRAFVTVHPSIRSGPSLLQSWSESIEEPRSSRPYIDEHASLSEEQPRAHRSESTRVQEH